MKRTQKLLIAALFFSAYAHAADLKKETMPTVASASDIIKIKFVDPYKVIQGLEEWKSESKRIQEELESRNNQIEAMKAQYQKKAQELQGMGSTAKPAVQEAKREELMNLQNSIEIKTQGLREFAERISQEAQMKIFKQIEEATSEVAQEKGYDIVLAGGAIYVNPKLDISHEVVERMNKKYNEKQKRQAKPAALPEATKAK